MKKALLNMVTIIYILLMILILIFSMISGLKNDLVYFIISLILTIFIIYFGKKHLFIKKIINNKSISIILIILGIIIRILLLFINYGEVFSDEATFYSNAINLSMNQPLNDRYIAMFPYLYSYILLLGNFMKIFGTNFISVVILNIIMDIIAALFAYLFGKTFKNKELGKKLMFIWLLNPFQILWCMKSLPIIVVNLCIIISLYLFAKLVKKNDIKRKIILSILLGICLGISNSFRPIFIIFIIAIFIYYIYLIIYEKYDTKNQIVSFIIIILIFSCINNSYTKLVSYNTKYNIGSSSGWTLYLGSNYESHGSWFYSEEYNNFITEDNFNPSEVHNYFKEKAIENYKQYDLLKIIKLYARKYYILTSNVSNYTYENTIATYIAKQIIKIVLYTFWNTIIILNLKTKSKSGNELIFLKLLEIGLILSHLFVEVSPRYFLPSIIPLIIIAFYSNYDLTKSQI